MEQGQAEDDSGSHADAGYPGPSATADLERRLLHLRRDLGSLYPLDTLVDMAEAEGDIYPFGTTQGRAVRTTLRGHPAFEAAMIDDLLTRPFAVLGARSIAEVVSAGASPAAKGPANGQDKALLDAFQLSALRIYEVREGSGEETLLWDLVDATTRPASGRIAAAARAHAFVLARLVSHPAGGIMSPGVLPLDLKTAEDMAAVMRWLEGRIAGAVTPLLAARDAHALAEGVVQEGVRDAAPLLLSIWGRRCSGLIP